MKTNQSHNTVFFAKEGISSSHANHISNLLKEQNKLISKRLAGVNAFTYKVTIDRLDHKISSTTVVKDGDWEREGRYYALSAWLREAIKARNNLLDFYKTCDVNEFLEDEETISEFTDIAPVRNSPIGIIKFTEIDAIGEFSIAQRAEYYSLEAHAAHIGKYIHSGGILSNVKDDLAGGSLIGFHKIIQNGQPTEIPMIATANFESEAINTEYFRLQAKHREYESKLNSYKARIQNRVTEKNAELQRDCTNASAAANNAYNNALNIYNANLAKFNGEIEELNSILQTRRLEKVRAVSAYKITIPNELSKIYQDIDQLGK